nr:d-lactate dehydrogenase [cytochrome], mitochondrial [Quercus suber]
MLAKIRFSVTRGFRTKWPRYGAGSRALRSASEGRVYRVERCFSPSQGRAYTPQSFNKAVQAAKDQTFNGNHGLAAFAIFGGLLTVWLLASDTHAEAPAGAYQDRQDSATWSTKPLSAMRPLQFNLSEKNLDGAHDEFVDLLGREGVSRVQGERIARSSTEWSPAPREDDIPSMIVYPRDTQDVSKIATICHRRRIPMIGFSGGTSLEGTLAAQHQEVCIDFNRHMNQVLEVRKDDMDVTVQPSVGYQELNEVLAKHDMFFPPDPGPGAQIGGMVAQGCSGTNAYRYGTMKDWVLGLEIVLADGTIIQTRHRPRKSSSGYDLTRLFTGSEGTLGLITKAHLKLTKRPDNVRVAVAQFPTIGQAVKMATNILQSGLQLEAMELLDDLTMHAVNEGGYCSTEWAERPTLFLKIAGPTPQTVAHMAKEVEETAKKSGSLTFRLAASTEEGEELWEARKTALWSTLALKNHPDDKFLSADACVPVSRLGDIIQESQKKMTESKMLGSFLGHVGDGTLLLVCRWRCSLMTVGNFHATVLYSAQEKEKARTLISDIQDMSVDMDGTVSGEHGIGLEYRDKVVYELGQSSVDAMRCLKLALDPLCLLNPGKMIRMELDPADGANDPVNDGSFTKEDKS